MTEYTLTDLQSALHKALAAAPGAVSDAQAYVDAAAAELLALAQPGVQTPRRIDRNLLDKDTLYAVPDDALNLFPALVQAAIGAFAKGPAAALPDLVSTLLRYRTLRVVITPQEAAVLRALKQARLEGQGPLAVADIDARLQAQGLGLGSSQTETLLAGLNAKKTDKAALVREANGRWSIGNV